jgi:uncharacterized RmlC-like cupin family protein
MIFGRLARMRYGQDLRDELEVRAGQFLFIPAGPPRMGEPETPRVSSTTRARPRR